MFITTTKVWPVLAAIVFVLSISHTASAQSSLFSVPTSDVVGKDQFYFETDFDTHFGSYDKGGWQSYGLFGVYGTSKKTEIGLNGYLVRGADGLEPVELQPNFKFQAYNNESKGVAVAVGTIAYIPLAKRVIHDAIASVYGVASKKFKSEWSPRVTGGGYQLIGAGSDSGSKRGFLLGLEQPVHKRLSFIADWNSGKNRFGYAAAGFGLTLTKRSYLWTAYYFGNQGRANNSLGIYYGYSF
jgi:hypothetical protein